MKKKRGARMWTYKGLKARYIYLRRKIYHWTLKVRIRERDFTIISQNCIGGVIYSELNMPFLSPTINLYIEGENFIKLVENLEYYMSIEATPLTDNYTDPIDHSIHYPKIKIDDIEVCCLHYHNCREAIEAWERRKKRINYNKIYVIGNSWNLHENSELVQRLSRNKYKTVIFTYNNYNLPNAIQMKGEWNLDNRGIIRPNITDYSPDEVHFFFEKQLNLAKFLR